MHDPRAVALPAGERVREREEALCELGRGRRRDGRLAETAGRPSGDDRSRDGDDQAETVGGDPTCIADSSDVKPGRLSFPRT